MGATIGTWLLTWLRGARVGSDEYGNRYYRLKGDKPQRLGGGRFSRERRWVIYKGDAEGSKVPPEWHAWLPIGVRRWVPAAATRAIPGRSRTSRT